MWIVLPSLPTTGAMLLGVIVFSTRVQCEHKICISSELRSTFTVLACVAGVQSNFYDISFCCRPTSCTVKFEFLCYLPPSPPPWMPTLNVISHWWEVWAKVKFMLFCPFFCNITSLSFVHYYVEGLVKFWSFKSFYVQLTFSFKSQTNKINPFLLWRGHITRVLTWGSTSIKGSTHATLYRIKRKN